MAISLSDLVSMRTTVTAFCAESATIARTNITVAARVEWGIREFHPEGMTTSLRFRIWRIIMPDPSDASWSGTAVRAGDSITITGKGTYAVLDSIRPTTYSMSTEVTAIMTRAADGTYPMPTNATVTFEQTGLNAAPKKTANVWIYCASCQPRLDAYAAQWKWGAYVDPLFTYTGGGVLQAGDKIRWPDIVPNGEATIARPQRIYGMFPFWRLYFVQVDG